MKKIKKILSTILLGLVIIWASFILPQTAFAAWEGVADFDDNTTGNLVGQAGGSGWGANNWTATLGNMTVTGTDCNEGTQCAIDTGADDTVYRTLGSAVTSGVISFDMKATDEGTNAIEINRAANDAFIAGVQATTNNIVFRAATNENVVTGQNNGWYTIEIDFRTGSGGCTTTQVRARAKPAAGSFGSWTSCLGEGVADDVAIFQVRFSFASGRTLRIDDIKAGEAAAGGTTEFDMSPYNEFLFHNNWI